MPEPSTLTDLYLHIRIIIGMVLGLAVARLLNGLAVFVQHPGREKVWWPHLAWVAVMLLQVAGFWWWEFRLAEVRYWSFETYLFVIAYAALLFFLCTLLFPSELTEFDGYREYLLSRRGWFFGLLAATLIMDIVDSRMKGAEHLASLGPGYWIRIAVFGTICLTAMRVDTPRAQGIVAAIALICQAVYLVTEYGTLI